MLGRAQYKITAGTTGPLQTNENNLSGFGFFSVSPKLCVQLYNLTERGVREEFYFRTRRILDDLHTGICRLHGNM